MTEQVITPFVVVDTGVFSSGLSGSGHALAFRYRPLLEGRRRVISFVTQAELRFGATYAGWGLRRMTRLETRLATATTVWATPELVHHYVDLRRWCVQNGHGLGQKDHEADRWVAATALMLGIPLVSDDRIFIGVDRLQLLMSLT